MEKSDDSMSLKETLIGLPWQFQFRQGTYSFIIRRILFRTDARKTAPAGTTR